MVDTRRRNWNPSNDDNGYGDVPQGAVGFRGEGREYPGGYGSDANEFSGGVIDDGRGGPPDDEGFDPGYSRPRSGYGAFGTRDPNDPDGRSGRNDERSSSGQHRGRGPKGYRRSDERIHEDVCERPAEDPFIDASNVEVIDEGWRVHPQRHRREPRPQEPRRGPGRTRLGRLARPEQFTNRGRLRETCAQQPSTSLDHS